MGVRDRGEQFRRLVHSAFADLLDQRKPFGRLALTHVLMTAGDTLVTISLAGSLFFSISPQAAKGKVFLYLVLTMAPFAVVAPALGPLIDRSRGARRALVMASAIIRVVICPFMARDVHSLLLFPEAFTMLVMSKLYLVTRGALVPAMASLEDDAGSHDGQNQLAVLNARLGLLASLSGLGAAIPAVIVLKLLGSPGVLWLDAAVFVAAGVAGFRLPVDRRSARPPGARRSGAGVEDPEEYGVLRDEFEMPARPYPYPEGTTQGLAGEPAGLPVGSDQVPPRPDGRPEWPQGAEEGGPGGGWGEGEADTDLRPATHPEVVLALMPMSLIRGMVGFLTFLLAFDLRRAHYATIWYGVVLAGSTAGALLGVLSVSRLRQWLTEQQILMLGTAVIIAAALFAAFVHGILTQAVLTLAVGLAGSISKPSFDALAQRFVPPAEQGRAFARFETRLQVFWVLGGLLPVLFALAITDGDVLIACVAAATGVFYVSSRKALRHRAWPGRTL